MRTKKETTDYRPYYADFPSEWLHYIYAANCFQHAIGFKLPIFSRFTVGGLLHNKGAEFIKYIALHPGSRSNPDPQLSNAIEDFRDRIVEHCKEEGMIITGSKPITKTGYRTIAFYVGPLPKEGGAKYDFHFAFLNRKGLWEWKTPFLAARTAKTVEDASTGCQFCCYMLAPTGMTPKAVREMDGHVVQTRTETGKPVKLLEIDDTKSGRNLTRMILFLDENRAVNFEDNITMALPPWPTKPYVKLDLFAVASNIFKRLTQCPFRPRPSDNSAAPTP